MRPGIMWYQPHASTQMLVEDWANYGYDIWIKQSSRFTLKEGPVPHKDQNTTETWYAVDLSNHLAMTQNNAELKFDKEIKLKMHWNLDS